MPARWLPFSLLDSRRSIGPKPVVPFELPVAERRPHAGALRESPDKRRKSIASEFAARQSQNFDRALDGFRLALDLHQYIHPWIGLETDRRSREIVLRDLAVDFHSGNEGKACQELVERVEIVDQGGDLFADFVDVLNLCRTFPI